MAQRLRLSERDMKRSYKTALAVAGMSVIFAGCVQRTVYVRQPPPPPPAAVEPAPEQPAEVVTEAPPAPQVEVQVVAPGPGYVWTPGYWAWHGRWVADGPGRRIDTPFGWVAIGDAAATVMFGLGDTGVSRPADATPISKDQAQRA
jgi:hypothetical protein